MNAPPNIGSADDVVHWLANGTRDERFLDNIFAELCVRLQRAGIPVKRATLHILLLGSGADGRGYVACRREVQADVGQQRNYHRRPGLSRDDVRNDRAPYSLTGTQISSPPLPVTGSNFSS